MSKKSAKTTMSADVTTKVPKTTALRSKKPKPNATPVEVKATPANKTSRLLTLLQREQGATLVELQSVSKWQAHSVRGFLSATVRKKLSLPLMTELRSNGERVYRIADAASA